MKINKVVIPALMLIFALQATAFAQFIDMFTEESFNKQPAITEADVKAFINSDAVYHYLAGLDEDADVKPVDSYVKKNTGLSLERYIFVASKLGVTHSLMYETGLSEKELDTAFVQLPAYLRANAAERALVKKYNQQIGETFLRMNAD